MFDYFFTPEDELPPGLGWNAYGIGHITWLAVMFAIGVVACRYYKKQSTERQDKILKILALYILFQELLKDFIYWMVGGLNYGHLPLHICGISIFFCLIYAFRRNEISGAYIYGMGMPGALMALTFPDWTEIPFLNFSAINSFTIHGLLILFTMLPLSARRLVPDIRSVPKLTGLIVAMAVPIYFLNKYLETNFMFINTPSPGSPLIPLYNLFGNGYVIALAVIVVAVFILLFLPWEIIKRKKSSLQIKSQ